MRRLLRKVMWWVRRRRKEDELREELQFHLEEETNIGRAEGLPEDLAVRAARRDLGNVTLLVEDTRTLWTWTVVEQLAQDTRYVLRTLWRSPTFTAVAILTLAVGIGVNTAIFGVINGVLLRPLPYRDPSSLVLIESSPVLIAAAWLTTAWRHHVRTLADIVGFNGPRPATLVHMGVSQQVEVADVTSNFLSLLGAVPAIGRDFVTTDAAPGADAVGLLSHDLWQRAFGSDPAIVGKTLTITGDPVTIIGVAPAGFLFPTSGARPAGGALIATQPDILRIANANAWLNVIGRLAPGHSSTSAASELLGIFKHEAQPRFTARLLERWQLTATPLQDRLVGSVRRHLWLAMGAVGFVMLVACANVANLLIARASTRQRELALRMALGAGASRLARLVLTEGLVLALLGSAVGLLFAYATSGVARALLADRIVHTGSIPIDARVLAFNVGVAIVTGIVCSLVSMPRSRRFTMFSGVDSNSPTVAGRSRMRRVLLSAETAVTFVLVIGAALFVQTFWNLLAQDRGFDADRLLRVRVSPGLPRNLDQTDRRARSKYFAQFFSDLRLRLEDVPGVASAGGVSLAPLDGISAGFTKVAVDGRVVSTDESVVVPISYATPGYFRTLQMPMIAGRDFAESDRLGTDLVAIVNETFQRRFAPNREVLGARITSGSGSEQFTVVGVVKDAPDRSLRQGPEPLIVAPLAQMPGVHISWGALTFFLRAGEGDPLRLAPEVRRTIWAINPNIVINELSTMNARIAVAMRSERDSALLFGLFALAALTMGAIGVYGVAAYTIVQRTKEIGIRVALGAAGHDVGRLILSQTLWPTLAGIAIGVVAAAVLTRFMAVMVYGVTPLDPWTFVSGIGIVVMMALAATWMPARRAMRIDPLVALRHE